MIKESFAVVWQNYYFFEKQYTYLNKTKVGKKIYKFILKGYSTVENMSLCLCLVDNL